jgi:hypothetical protein
MGMGALGAAILYILVSTLSETDVEAHRWRILGVALGAGLFETVLSHILPGFVWALVILIVEVLLIAFALAHWCSTPRQQAIKVAGVFTGIRIVFAIGIALFFGPRGGAV